jgi:FtsZ-binding cell division protein ZapB
LEARIALHEAEVAQLKDDNDALVAQRKTLTKGKESLTRDLDKLKKENDAQIVLFQQNIDRLSQANDRLNLQLQELFNDKNTLNSQLEELNL